MVDEFVLHGERNARPWLAAICRRAAFWRVAKNPGRQLRFHDQIRRQLMLQRHRVDVCLSGLVISRSGELGISEAPQMWSHVPRSAFASTRLQKDRRIAATKLPRNTREAYSASYGPDGVGWVYSITNSFGTTFTLFAFFDGAAYQVWVVSPEIERRFKNAHTGHLYPDGRICLHPGHGGGMPTLDGAFAKSAVWTEGITVVINGGTFPWNYDQ
jgi:hypothetical protein